MIVLGYSIIEFPAPIFDREMLFSRSCAPQGTEELYSNGLAVTGASTKKNSG